MSEEMLSSDLDDIQSLRCEIDSLKRELEILQTDQQNRKKENPSMLRISTS